jgi:hypothetical protein
MDIMRVGGMYENFIKYQGRLHRVFEHLQKEFGFNTIHGGKSPQAIAREIRGRIEKILNSSVIVEKSAPIHENPFVTGAHLQGTASSRPKDEKDIPLRPNKE